MNVTLVRDRLRIVDCRWTPGSDLIVRLSHSLLAAFILTSCTGRPGSSPSDGPDEGRALPVITARFDPDTRLMRVEVTNHSQNFLEIGSISINEYPSNGLPAYDSQRYRADMNSLLLDADSPLAFLIVQDGSEDLDLGHLQNPGAIWLAPGVSCAFSKKIPVHDVFKKSRFVVGGIALSGKTGAIVDKTWTKCEIHSNVILLWENALVDGSGVE